MIATAAIFTPQRPPAVAVFTRGPEQRNAESAASSAQFLVQ
jgi:hypothetical protein